MNAVYNNAELTKRVTAALKSSISTENIIKKDPVMGGDDFRISAWQRYDSRAIRSAVVANARLVTSTWPRPRLQAHTLEWELWEGNPPCQVISRGLHSSSTQFEPP